MNPKDPLAGASVLASFDAEVVEATDGERTARAVLLRGSLKAPGSKRGKLYVVITAAQLADVMASMFRAGVFAADDFGALFDKAIADLAAADAAAGPALAAVEDTDEAEPEAPEAPGS